MRWFRRGRREGGLPSITRLVLLFLFTMALPAALLLLVSLNLAGNEDLQSEQTITEEFDRLGEAFVSELEKATEDILAPYLQVDWSSALDSENFTEEMRSNFGALPYLFGEDWGVVYPLFGESPWEDDDGAQDSPRSWREALERVRAFSESGESGAALEELRSLRNFSLKAAQRAEILLEEATILARNGETDEAWERLERIVRIFPEARSPSGTPLALAALEGQVELGFPLGRWEPMIRLAEALFSGAYYPSEPTENFLWSRLLNLAREAATEVYDRIEALRTERNERVQRARRLESQLASLASRVSPSRNFALRIIPNELPFDEDEDGQSAELIHRAEVENSVLWVVWSLDSTLLWDAIAKAMEEVERFHASAVLRVESPDGRDLANRPREPGQAIPQPDRILNLTSPWQGWRLMMGLEHIGSLRKSIAREREDAAKVVVISGFVLLFGAFLVFRGIRRQMQVTRAKSNFVSAVSHELRTPIANIRMFGEMLQMGVASDDRDRAIAYEAITSETERLSRLIEGVLNYSRIQQGAKVFHVEETDLVELTESVLERARQGLPEDFQFEFSIKGTPRPARVDPDAYSQALENLLTNAAKYSPHHRTAWVEIAYTQKRRIEVSVADRGIGLSRRDRKRIFERFHRVEDELTRKTGGAGLGLTLARDLIQGFGGSISVKSRLGEGSRFTLTIPDGGSK